MSKVIFPAADGEFNRYVQKAVPHLVEHKKRLNIPDAQLNELKTLKNAWDEIYPKSQDPSKRTSVITGEKISLRKRLEQQFRKLFGGFYRSFINRDDRSALSIYDGESDSTTSYDLNHSPEPNIEEIKQGMHILSFTPPGQNPGSRHRIELQNYVGDSDLSESQIRFGTLKITSNNSTEIEYNGGRGRTAYYRARYITEQGDKGPFSEIVSALIV